KLLCRLEGDHQLEFGRLLDWQIARLSPTNEGVMTASESDELHFAAAKDSRQSGGRSAPRKPGNVLPGDLGLRAEDITIAEPDRGHWPAHQRPFPETPAALSIV